jgi:hypothetical protein
MNLILDESTHTYTLDGKRLPHVTGILASEGLIDCAWYTEYGRDRGRKVHNTIQFYDDGELDEDSLDPVLRLYLEAWKQFQADTGIVIQASEIKLASETYGFAGKLDKLAILKDTKVIIDIKSGAVQPWTALQLALYQILLGDPTAIRCAVQLSDDGKYRLHRFTNRQDRQVALAVLTVHQWKIRNGGTK